MVYHIILAGGKGSRFYPITKYYPKEMLPIYNLPALHYVLNETNNNEIDKIILLYRYHGEILKSYIQNECQNLSKKILFIQQPDIDKYGTGASILKLKHILEKENMFAISFSDDVVFDEHLFKNMFLMMQKDKLSACIASSKIKQYDIPFFGNLKLDIDNKVIQILQKPKIISASSYIALVSKLVVSPKIFNYLDKAYYKDELDLGIALSNMCRNEKVKSYDVTGKWITVGDPNHYIEGINLWHKKFMKKF